MNLSASYSKSQSSYNDSRCSSELSSSVRKCCVLLERNLILDDCASHLKSGTSTTGMSQFIVVDSNSIFNILNGEELSTNPDLKWKVVSCPSKATFAIRNLINDPSQSGDGCNVDEIKLPLSSISNLLVQQYQNLPVISSSKAVSCQSSSNIKTEYPLALEPKNIDSINKYKLVKTEDDFSLMDIENDISKDKLKKFLEEESMFPPPDLSKDWSEKYSKIETKDEPLEDHASVTSSMIPESDVDSQPFEGFDPNTLEMSIAGSSSSKVVELANKLSIAKRPSKLSTQNEITNEAGDEIIYSEASETNGPEKAVLRRSGRVKKKARVNEISLQYQLNETKDPNTERTKTSDFDSEDFGEIINGSSINSDIGKSAKKRNLSAETSSVMSSIECSKCLFNCSSRHIYKNHLKAHFKKKSFGTCESSLKITKKLNINELSLRTHEEKLLNINKRSLGTSENSIMSNKGSRNNEISLRNNQKSIKEKDNSLLANQKSPKKNKKSLIYKPSLFASFTNSLSLGNPRSHSGEKRFKCDVCSYVTSEKSKLSRHIRTHTGERPFKCMICSYAASRKCYLTVHIRTHTGEKPFKCNICSYAALETTTLKKHMKIHSGERPFKCKLCSYAAAQRSTLTTHMKIHLDEKPFKCNICSYAACQKFHLDRHMTSHTGEKAFKCDICSYEASSKFVLSEHIKTHTGERPFKCNICSYAATKRSDLTAHMRTHSGEKPFKCNICSYATSRSGNLSTHTKTHTKKKPFKCNLCSYAAYNKSALVPHMKIHTGEKPFKCNVCSYAASFKCALTRHIRKHTGEKPFKCNICSYATFIISNLSTHTKTHTKEKPFKCNLCSYAASQKSTLIMHMRIHTGEKPFKCNICSYAATKLPDITTHMRNHS